MNANDVDIELLVNFCNTPRKIKKKNTIIVHLSEILKSKNFSFVITWLQTRICCFKIQL